MNIIEFHSRYHCYLSNFYADDLRWRDTTWPTAEHAYQAAKYLNDPEMHSYIRALPSPAMARREGRSYRSTFDPNWDDHRVDVMIEILTAKFLPMTHLHIKLLDTGDAILKHVAPWDGYWGTGKYGNGLNVLGSILMDIRSKLPAYSSLPASLSPLPLGDVNSEDYKMLKRTFNSKVPDCRDVRCYNCSRAVGWVVTFPATKLLHFCTECGFQSKDRGLLVKHIRLKEWRCWLLTKMGIIRLSGISARWPKYFMDEFLVSPYEVQNQRIKMLEANGRSAAPRCVMIYRSSYMIETQLSDTRSTEVLAWHVNLPLGTFLVGEILINSHRYQGIFIEPRILWCNSKYSKIAPYCMTANEIYRLEIPPSRIADCHSRRIETNQLYTLPFTATTGSTVWTWVMNRSRLVFVRKGGQSIVPSLRFFSDMNFIDETSEYEVVRMSESLVKVMMTNGSMAYAGISNQGVIKYEGRIDTYADLMLGLLKLIRESLGFVTAQSIKDWRVLNQRAAWVSGAKSQ